MTREQKIAKARELRWGGATFQGIADQLGVSVSTVHRWVVPGSADLDRSRAKAWKDANRERNRARDRAYKRQRREAEAS